MRSKICENGIARNQNNIPFKRGFKLINQNFMDSLSRYNEIFTFEALFL